MMYRRWIPSLPIEMVCNQCRVTITRGSTEHFCTPEDKPETPSPEQIVQMYNTRPKEKLDT